MRSAIRLLVWVAFAASAFLSPLLTSARDLMVFTANQEFLSRIYVMDTTGSVIDFHEYDFYRFVGMEVVDDELYVADAFAPRVYKIEPITGDLDVFIDDWSLYYFYDVAFDGTYFYVDEWDLNRYDINGNYAGVVHLTDEKPIWSAVSINSYSMPPQGAPVLLEIDYKNDNFFNVSLLIQEFGSFEKKPLLIIAHSEEWNKIYVNLGPNLSLHPSAINYRVIIEAGLELGKANAEIFIDNIKLIYRPF